MMTIDEAIKHAEDIASSSCNECAEEHRQLAAWLKQVKFMDELVESFKKFNGCFIDMCEVCHRECPSGTSDMIALDLGGKIHEYEKIRKQGIPNRDCPKTNPIAK